MSRSVPVDAPVTDQFPVWEKDGYTKKSGETSFTSIIWRDGVIQPISPVITEIDTSGEYQVTYTPDAKGFWLLEISIGYNKDVWAGEYDVIQGSESFVNLAFDPDTSILYAEAWLERLGDVVLPPKLTSCLVKVFDAAGIEIFSETSLTPDVRGIFSLSSVTSMTTERPYSITATIADSIGTVVTYHASSTAG